jgi:LysM repeat protein
MMRRRVALLVATTSLVIGCGGGTTASPGSSGDASPTPAPTDIFVETPGPSEVVVEPTPSPSAAVQTAPPSTGTRYTVKKGDTMWAIAKHFGITLEALQKANPKVKPTTMRIGTILVIPPKH